MTDFNEYYEARSLITDVLERDLVGPVADDEILVESPLSYYIAGKLYPQGMDDDSELEEQSGEAGDLEDSYDSPIVLSSQRRQSSMGITFVLDGSSKAIHAIVRYAVYKPLSEEEAASKGYHEKFLSNASSARTAVHLQRTPQEHVVSWSESEGPKRIRLSENAILDIRPKPIRGTDKLLVAVSLVNGNKASDIKLENSSLAYFQTQITVKCDEGCTFAPTESVVKRSSDDDLAELEMLYWHSRPYAHGHGCSADWDKASLSPKWVETESLPSFEILQMRPRELGDESRFSMKRLTEMPTTSLISDLTSFIEEYEVWIEEQRSLLSSVPIQYSDIASNNIAKCRECAERMRKAVDLLSKEGAPLRAFRLTNKAMLIQRVRSLAAKGTHVDEKDVRWYPFQLGFLLMQLTSFADPDGEDRAIADLLWFPTGGGKTEAYLGVAAYAIFLRRILDPAASGVTVIMRYTLRLLTLQQFERATALVAACDHIRREEGLGGDPITIGMYVGGTLTPNKLEEAESLIKGIREGKLLKEGQADPFQVRKCPWCGSRLTPEDYKVDKASSRMISRCPNEECEYHEGIPASVIDEDLYAHPPTFVVATVDKFAQVPLKEEAARILGIGVDCPPPELIIQDELHLISGPLGTMVGVYETAISNLCAAGGTSPKVITSTATAKSSSQQLLALYGQKSFQFPPQALDMRDSFFAIESTPQEKPGRLYLGVMGSDAAITTVAARAEAALLFATRYLEVTGYSADVVDSFWTLVEYFNTLRELGGSLTSLQDSVQNLFSFLASTKLKNLYPGVDADTRFCHVMELTSRRTSAEITQSFQELETKHAGPGNNDAIDFVLATNMLSVGVDVGRLNVMSVYGQPKVNSEYIQATSRVGRSTPGLVVSLLNPKRSRDRSHYEQFVGFHQSLYKHVESSTLTPFSDRARDRGLHTIFVTMCRYSITGMSANGAADNFRASMNGVEDIKRKIIEHVALVEPEEVKAVRLELDQIAIDWENRAGNGLTYFTMGKPAKSLFQNELENDRFRVMSSMRSVEPSVNLFEDR